jgi:hypothetical protein
MLICCFKISSAFGRIFSLSFAYADEILPIIDGCELTLKHEMPHGQEDFVEKSKMAPGENDRTSLQKYLASFAPADKYLHNAGL